MLKQRIMATAILIPIALATVLLLPQPFFSIVTGMVVVLAAWEWADISGWKSVPLKGLYALVTAAFAVLLYFLPGNSFLLGIGLAWWIMAIMLIISYPDSKSAWSGWLIKLVIGWLVLFPAWASLTFIREHEHGKLFLLYLFAIVWMADITAYFCGRWFGRHKLAAQISPGKTWQGAIGGFVMVAVLSLIVSSIAGMTLLQQLGMLIISLIVSVFSIFGDLLESMFKRERGIKDSGSIIPGHGGILDRIDSLTAAAPVFAILWIFSSLM